MFVNKILKVKRQKKIDEFFSSKTQSLDRNNRANTADFRNFKKVSNIE